MGRSSSSRPVLIARQANLGKEGVASAPRTRLSYDCLSWLDEYPRQACQESVTAATVTDSTPFSRALGGCCSHHLKPKALAT